MCTCAFFDKISSFLLSADSSETLHYICTLSRIMQNTNVRIRLFMCDSSEHLAFSAVRMTAFSFLFIFRCAAQCQKEKKRHTHTKLYYHPVDDNSFKIGKGIFHPFFYFIFAGCTSGWVTIFESWSDVRYANGRPLFKVIQLRVLLTPGRITRSHEPEVISTTATYQGGLKMKEICSVTTTKIKNSDGYQTGFGLST